MLTVSKEDSVMHRGIAILIMLYGHLFFSNNTDLCYNTFYLGGEPLAKFFSHACNPVPYFLILSGYGYSVIIKSESYNINLKVQFTRIFKLYRYYWLILSCFLTYGWLFDLKNIGGVHELILNYTGFQSQYIGATWFLLPFSCVVLAVKPLFKLIDTIRPILFLILSLSIGLISFYFLTVKSYEGTFRPLMLFLGFLYPFSWGVFFHRCRWNLNLGSKKNNFIYISLILLCFLIAGFSHRQLAFFLPYLLFFLFNQIRYNIVIKKTLIKLGEQSMPMWMIHTVFCSYYFREELYSLKYPILIFPTLVVISYISALIVNYIISFTQKSFHVSK